MISKTLKNTVIYCIVLSIIIGCAGTTKTSMNMNSGRTYSAESQRYNTWKKQFVEAEKAQNQRTTIYVGLCAGACGAYLATDSIPVLLIGAPLAWGYFFTTQNIGDNYKRLFNTGKENGWIKDQ